MINKASRGEGGGTTRNDYAKLPIFLINKMVNCKLIVFAIAVLLVGGVLPDARASAEEHDSADGSLYWGEWTKNSLATR